MLSYSAPGCLSRADRGCLDKLYDPPIVCRSVRIPAYVAEDTSEVDATEVHYVARYAWWNNIDGTFI